MTSKQDYIGMIKSAKDLGKIATYIRAFGCRTCSGLRTAYSDGESMATLQQYDHQADEIERCTSLAEARRLLKTWGF